MDSSDKINEGTLDAANRLLECENIIQQKIEHLEVELQKGILIQALVKVDDEFIYIITKAEHLDFIDEKNKKKSKGLPVKKKIFKSFAAFLNSKKELSHAMVCDSNAKISAFWFKEFLELQPVHDDSWNTKKAFESLDSKVFSKMKKDHPEDYLYLRNATVQYFRSKEEFVLEDYIKDIVTTYTPADENLKIDTLKTKIQGLPEKENFDSRFEIKKNEIKQRYISKIKLTEQLSLEIKEDLALNDTVRSIIIDGIKYIRIRTESGYNFFKKD